MAHSLPAGLLGALVLIVGVETAVSRHGSELSGYKALAARFAVEHAGGPAARTEVLGLGDSQVKFGLDPAVLQRELGLDAYNLAVPGTPPPLAHALLARVLASGGRPRALVLGFMTLGGGPRENLDAFAETLGLTESLELARSGRDPALFGMIATRRLLPSLRYREGLRLAVRSMAGAGGAGDILSARQAEQFWADWETHHGAEVREATGRFDGRMEPDLERRLYSNVWRVQPVFEGYLRRTAALADAHQIPVYWLLCPITPSAQARRDQDGLDAAHTRNLFAVLARMRNVTVIDARHAGFPASAFLDSCHLNAEGSALLTAAVARAIESGERRDPGAVSATDRWLSLVPFDPRSPRIAVEPTSLIR